MSSKKLTQFDIPEIFQVYQTQRNYKIHLLSPCDDRCIIYFSSHGIYYPNTKQAFQERIIHGDHFEWSQKFIHSTHKVIFIRDILKTWYLKGINAELDSIETLLDFLRQETKGLRITCVGSSAGGYAATLFGSLLNAEKVFNFCGQFSLQPYLEKASTRCENPVLAEFETVTDVSQYYNLGPFIQECTVPIFYLFPFWQSIDWEQAKYAEAFKNIYSFAFNSRIHGVTCYPINFSDLFNLSLPELFKLNSHCKHRIIDPFWFSLKVSGTKKTLAYLLKLAS